MRAQAFYKILMGFRPSLPPDMPAGYRSVMKSCWAADPAARPSFEVVICCLQVSALCLSDAQCITSTVYNGVCCLAQEIHRLISSIDNMKGSEHWGILAAQDLLQAHLQEVRGMHHTATIDRPFSDERAIPPAEKAAAQEAENAAFLTRIQAATREVDFTFSLFIAILVP